VRDDMGPDDVREACYRLCGAMRLSPPWLPSTAELRANLEEAYVQRDLLLKAIAQSEAALSRLSHNSTVK
jgi:hypothetical protein